MSFSAERRPSLAPATTARSNFPSDSTESISFACCIGNGQAMVKPHIICLHLLLVGRRGLGRGGLSLHRLGDSSGARSFQYAPWGSWRDAQAVSVHPGKRPASKPISIQRSADPYPPPIPCSTAKQK